MRALDRLALGAIIAALAGLDAQDEEGRSLAGFGPGNVDPTGSQAVIAPDPSRSHFGLNARHGGPDSRSLPNAQTAEDVATVIADLIETRRADVYTRAGARERIASYYASVGEDP